MTATYRRFAPGDAKTTVRPEDFGLDGEWFALLLVANGPPRTVTLGKVDDVFQRWCWKCFSAVRTDRTAVCPWCETATWDRESALVETQATFLARVARRANRERM